ncbi:hypothetical protein M9Y10_000215 [Tritrichomonas musculus]|uniref:Uncharacterized protein n=1 Tax=Tritrichomonas musculus TaxID=1915356 RepID=A0ABR2L3N3_9EUKA
MIIKSRNFDSYLNIQSYLSTASGMRTRICFERVVFYIYSSLKTFNVQFIGKRLRAQIGDNYRAFSIYIFNQKICSSSTFTGKIISFVILKDETLKNYNSIHPKKCSSLKLLNSSNS